MDYAESSDRQPPEPTFRKEHRATRLRTDSGLDTATYLGNGSLTTDPSHLGRLLQGAYSVTRSVYGFHTLFLPRVAHAKVETRRWAVRGQAARRLGTRPVTLYGGLCHVEVWMVGRGHYPGMEARYRAVVSHRTGDPISSHSTYRASSATIARLYPVGILDLASRRREWCPRRLSRYYKSVDWSPSPGIRKCISGKR